MNTLNDRGEMVPALGEPGSVERVKCEWPWLINRIWEQYTNHWRNKGSQSEHFIVSYIRHDFITHRIPRDEWPTFLAAAGASQDEIDKVMGVQR